MMGDLNAFVDLGNNQALESADSGVLINNIQARLQFAKKLRDRVRQDSAEIDPNASDLSNFELNLMQLAAVMFADFDTIQNPVWDRENGASILNNILAPIESLLGICEL